MCFVLMSSVIDVPRELKPATATLKALRHPKSIISKQNLLPLRLDGGFQYLQSHLSATHCQLRAHSERERDVARCDVTRPYAEGDRDSQIADDSGDDLLQSVILICGLYAVEHFSEDDAAHIVEMAANFQLHQHAIDLKRLGGDIFQEQNLTGRLDVAGRTERSHQDRKASTV